MNDNHSMYLPHWIRKGHRVVLHILYKHLNIQHDSVGFIYKQISVNFPENFIT
jgi:hypothetical protein